MKIVHNTVFMYEWTLTEKIQDFSVQQRKLQFNINDPRRKKKEMHEIQNETFNETA